MKKLLVGIVTASTILFVALSSVSYAGDVVKAQQPDCASYATPSSADGSSPSQMRNLKAQLLAVLSSLLKSSSPIVGIVVPHRPVIDPTPPSKIPPDDTPPGIPVYDKIRLDHGWDEKK